MKAALNGGLNLSILDGWWDEWFDGNNGWAIPSADGVEDPDRRDDIEANALYDLIENEVAPRFYDVDGDGLPQRWLEMVRHTAEDARPKVLASRMVRDYTEQLYVPGRASGWALAEGRLRRRRDLAAYKARVRDALGRRARRPRRVLRASATRPEVGETLHVHRVRLARRAHARRRRGAGRARPHEPPRRRAARRLHGPARARGVLRGTVATVRRRLVLRSSGAFGYTVRVLPEARRARAARPSSGLVANA